MRRHETHSNARWPAFCGAAALLLSPVAHGAVTSCTVSAGALGFGTYDPTLPAVLTSTGTIDITCTVTSHSNPLSIALSAGSGTYTARTMMSGASKLGYNLYLDAAHTQVWGDGTGGSVLDNTTIVRHAGVAALTATVYGLLPALQDVAPGTYTDTITVTVSF